MSLLVFNKDLFLGPLFHLLYHDTALLTKVVPRKRKSVRDNADWYYG